MYERLLDREHAPSVEALTRYCGENGGRFTALNEGLSARFHTVRQIRFPYGKQYGWCITHRLGKRLVCDVFAEAGAFTVMLRLSDAQFQSIYPALRADTQKQIDNRYPCGDGGWLHFRVTGDEQLADIEKMLDVKCR